MRESGLGLFRKLIPSPDAHLVMGVTLSLRERVVLSRIAPAFFIFCFA